MKYKSALLLLLAMVVNYKIIAQPVNKINQQIIVPLKEQENNHPRLLLNPKRIASLHLNLTSSHAFIWNRYLQDLPLMMAVSKRDEPLEDERYDGDLIIELAFAWLMTGRGDLKDIAKKQLLRIASDETWATDEGLIYLVPAHYIQGLALGYDWMYPALSPTERTIVAERLGREAANQQYRITNDRIWWSTQFLQNHGQSNMASLAFAAAALTGEDKRAGEWRATTDKFFEQVFALLPKDGSSVEGYAYAGYGMEYVLNYLLLARDAYGIDYSGSQAVKNFTDYLLHGLLPKRIEQEWAMTFGDAPRRGWTSTAQHLFTIARLHKNTTAQWMAMETLRLYKKGLGSHGWMMMLGYDPTIIPAKPATFSTYKYFNEIDQVMMRSSWTDSNATMIGFKCGPFLGKSLSKIAPYDYGAAHQNTDAGSFQLFSNGSLLAIDPGYTGQDRTEDHNTMLFKQHGQLGEVGYFGTGEALRFRHYPTIIHSEDNPNYSYIIGDVTHAYHPALGLKKFTRQLLYIKPGVLLVADEVILKEAGVVYDMLSENLETFDGLTHAANGYVVGSEGKASFTFTGATGIYKIALMYLDNKPVKGRYSFEVDGQKVYSWISRNEKTDDNLSAVSDAVILKKGSIVSFTGQSMPVGTRITKMSVFSETVNAPVDASWLLHLDAKSVVKQYPKRLEATIKNSTLELYSLFPKDAVLSIEQHKVSKPEIEPFTPRETKRVLIKPVFDGNHAFLLNMLHARNVNERSIQNIKATKKENIFFISFIADGKETIIRWDIREHKIKLQTTK